MRRSETGTNCPRPRLQRTCAAIASFHWSWRLLLATGQARYADLMEGLPYTAPPAGSAPDGARRLVATAVPYFQWDNRDGRAMRVWLPAAD